MLYFHFFIIILFLFLILNAIMFFDFLGNIFIFNIIHIFLNILILI